VQDGVESTARTLRLELAGMRRRSAQQEEALAGLRRALQIRDEFLAMASHELRTPITTLGLQTEGLLHLGARISARPAGDGRPGADSEDRLRRRLLAIRNQVVRLDRLVDQLLDVSRLLEGRLDLHPEAVDLLAVVSDVVDLLREPAARAGSPVHLRGDAGLLGQWDRFRLEQVVTNLLSNAIKFGEGGAIGVEVEGDAERARLVVRDAGQGIPVEEQQRIFERFERASNGRSHPGLGLGLWISKRIVDAIGGTISVESRPGGGSVFAVELPRGEATTEPSAPHDLNGQPA
jgi:signal transduction histidine kinase